MLSSEELAEKINELTNDGIGEIIFVIGSSCGISLMSATIKVCYSLRPIIESKFPHFETSVCALPEQR